MRQGPQFIVECFMINWDLFGDDKSTEFLAQYTADQLKIRADDVYAALEWKSSDEASALSPAQCGGSNGN